MIGRASIDVKGARLVKTYTPVWERTLAILAYHKIGPAPRGWETWYYVSEPTFAAHLAYLQDEGWEFLDLQGLLHCLEEPDRLPARAALVTFDDGYRSLLKHALPVLHRFDCPAVVFVPTDFIGGRNTFDEGNEPAEPICGWDDLRVLEREGVAVQSHGGSHRPLLPRRLPVQRGGERLAGRPVPPGPPDRGPRHRPGSRTGLEEAVGMRRQLRLLRYSWPHWWDRP
jgi:hypothetical protein